MPGVRFADVGDAAAVEEALATGRIAAVFIEPIQGEGGVQPVPAAFLRSLRGLCDRYDALLVFDEIQCGLGRTGKLFAYQHAGVTPDILTLAKPLAGGLPMGAVIAVDKVAAAMKPGDHGTTFGGGPLVASAALAVTRTVADPAFLARVTDVAAHLVRGLERIQEEVASVKGVRGMGLMQGLVLDGPAAPVVKKARELGLLVVSAGAEVVRLVPPLVITSAEVDEGLEILHRAMLS
jgi:acetylornithine/succinyldiaminopimelate/putrescine aminotransferase